MIPLVPIGGRVLVKPLQPPDTTDSGLVLVRDQVPETMGEVLAVASTGTPPVQVGDVVLFSWQAGQEVLIDGDRVLLLHEDDLLAVVQLEAV